MSVLDGGHGITVNVMSLVTLGTNLACSITRIQPPGDGCGMAFIVRRHVFESLRLVRTVPTNVLM